MPFWNMSLVASTKQWNAAELTKTVCTQRPGAHYCALEQVSTLLGTGTVATCSRSSDSGARRETSESEEKLRRKRGRGREERTAFLCFHPLSHPIAFFFFLLLTSLCAVPTIWTPGTSQHISGILPWVLKKGLSSHYSQLLNFRYYGGLSLMRTLTGTQSAERVWIGVPW